MRIYLDIDGVLADSSHRMKYIDHKNKDYDKYYSPELIERDIPLKEVFDLIIAPRLWDINMEIILVTGRRESCKKHTIKWLNVNFAYPFYKCEMFFRKSGDLRCAPEIKRDFIKDYEFSHPTNDTVYFVDDSEDNIRAVKNACPHIIGVWWAHKRILG